MRILFFIGIIWLLFQTAPAYAEQGHPIAPMVFQKRTLKEQKLSKQEPLTTSRPSFTDAAITVPKGSLQIETGASFLDNNDDTWQWSLPEALLRLGLTDDMELRFTAPLYTYQKKDDGDTLINNFGDIAIGLGHHHELPGKLDIAVYPLLNLPTGARKASANAVDPELRVVLSKNLTERLQVASMLDARWTTSREALQDAVLTPSVIASYRLNERLTSFVEYAGIIPTGTDPNSRARDSHWLQAGILCLLRPRHQVDVRVAAGLNKDAPNLIVGFGYSYRLDGLF